MKNLHDVEYLVCVEEYILQFFLEWESIVTRVLRWISVLAWLSPLCYLTGDQFVARCCLCFELLFVFVCPVTIQLDCLLREIC